MGFHGDRSAEPCLVGKSTSSCPTLSVDGTGTGVLSHARAVTLLRTAEATALTAALSDQLSP